MCEVINGDSMTDTTLAAYVLWHVNWIHPFQDGNGRTARAACYFAVCRWIKLEPASKPALPDLIAQEPIKYRRCLESADGYWAKHQTVNVSQCEGFLARLLKAELRQLADAGNA
jgi:Fic family protein